MHFSVTKEVGWEADDEREGPKPNRGVKKRYRIILDFSRRSSKRKPNPKTTPRKGPPPESDFESDDEHAADRYEDGTPRPLQHYCYNCEAPRSIHYQQDHPLRRGTRPSLCAECRAGRYARLAAAEDAEDSQDSQDGKPHPHPQHHHHEHRPAPTAAAAAAAAAAATTAAALEPRGDDREWCAKCGILRSNRFHDKVLLTGGAARLPPWKESLWGDCRSRPYGFGRGEVGGREGGGGVPVAGGTAASGVRGGFEQAGDKERGGSPLAAIGAREDVSRSSSGVSTAPEPPRANARKATVENATPEDDRVGVRGGRQVRQGAGENRQSQQPGQPTYGQPKGAQAREEHRLATANSALGCVETPKGGRELRDCFRPPHLDEYFKEKVRPKPKPHDPRDKPMPPPAPSAASSSQQYQAPHETREYFQLPNPMKPLEPGKKPTTTEPKQRRDQGNLRDERHPTRHGHRQRASVSSMKSPMPTAAEPVYFKGHVPAKVQVQQPKPTSSTNPFRNRRKSEPKAEPKQDVRFEQQQQQQKQCHYKQAREQEQSQQQQQQREQHQQEQQAPPPRPMGISDMYWSSAHGQAEQTYAAAAFFFPSTAPAHDGGVTEDAAGSHRSTAAGSANSSQNDNNGSSNNGNGDNNTRRHRHRRPAENTAEHATEHTAAGAMPDFGHVFRASMGHTAAAAEANAADFDGDDNQIWEVDSDEAEEIEEVRARMFC
ncbi:hypothetical protein F5144DRAFT_546748 [Chaetomium tenue]|uniref:Uncharacterized protein n=1 Tax=Chaetomium tenue TaxID=1854479 RepID=A0ACB7PCP7_9PEZI|nr:hypothetical protein F5144DRAFT_546748 [Chaetomium globosum]